jgi:protein-tyrosine phosphatase
MNDTNPKPNRTARRRRARRIALLLGVGIPVFVVGLGMYRQGRPVETTPPPADAEPGRWFHVDGAQNTRDVGGYPTIDGHTVRRGLVYRSGTLAHVTDAGCETFRDLGIHTVVDFRNRLTPWPLYNGDVLCVHLTARVHGQRVSFRKAGPRAGRYLLGLRENADAYIETFDRLADPDQLPLLYHCAAGTDRTGVMTALLLATLGVDRDTIYADFELSAKVGTRGNPEAMQTLLDEIEKVGGIDPFLTDLGVSSATLDAVRQNLIEPAE